MNDHFYKQLTIENFRGIKSLEIDDLARVNLFVGRNTCGKTSVLEAAFLLTGMSNPTLLFMMEKQRGVAIRDSSDLKNFFYNKKHSEKFRLSGSHRTENRELEVDLVYGILDVDRITAISTNGSRNGEGKRPTQSDPFSAAFDKVVAGLSFDFTYSRSRRKNSQFNATIYLVEPGDEPQFILEKRDEYKDPISALFQHHSFDVNSVDKMLGEKHQDMILSYLQLVEPKVQNIKIDLNRGVMVDIGRDNFLPIRHLGGGIVRILATLSNIYRAENGIVMIDEIENGLHAASIKQMWEMVLKASRQNHTQIFMTTHSSDVIEGLSMALQDKSDSVACFWLHKLADDRLKAHRYSPDALRDALDLGVDIRH